MASAVAHAALLGVIIAQGAGCAAPLQNGGVDVASGADDRLGLLCRWRRGDESRKDLCAPGDQQSAAPSRVRKIASAGEALKGPLASAGVGDYILENAEIAVAIRRVEATPLPGGGALIDAADARVRRDEIGEVVARFGDHLSPLYEKLAAGVEPDGTAWVEVAGHEANEPGLKIATRYSLGPVDRAVMITTALENKTPAPLGLFELGDAIAWGSTDVLAPPGEAPEGAPIKGSYIAAVGADVAYLIAPVKDADVAWRATKGASDLVIERDVALPAGARVQYERVLAIASRADSIAVATEFFYMQGGTPGGLFVKLVDESGASFASPPDGKLFLDRASASGEVIEASRGSWWMRTESGSAQRDASILGGEVPPGRYIVRYEGGGKTQQKAATIDIKPSTAAKLTLVLTTAAAAPSAPAPSGSPAPAE